MSGMGRRQFLKRAGAAAAGMALPAAGLFAQGEGNQARPNLLFFFPDQHRQQAMGFLGQDPVLTPNIDRFAAQSMVFTTACSNQPICSPARASLLTGKYSFSHHVTANCNSAHNKYGIYLRDSERCLSDVLYEAGYNCGFIGKWHLDPPEGPEVDHWSRGTWDAYTPPGPRRHHFEFWYSYGCMFDFFRPYFWAGDAERDQKTIIDQWEPEHEADVAIDYIRNPRGKHRDPERPFALFVAPHPPHPPFDQVPRRYLALYEGKTPEELLNRKNVFLDREGLRATRRARNSVNAYFAAVSGIDEQFGRILRCLAEEGLEEDTVVVFSSDHGEMMGSHGHMSKSKIYDESFLVPLIVRWPRHIPARSEYMPLSLTDFMPTFLGLAGLGKMTPGDVEGADYSSLLLGGASPQADSAPFLAPDLPATPQGGRRGLRTRRYAFLVGRRQGAEDCTLFDSEADPYQLTNVAAERPALIRELRGKLNDWLERMKDPWVRA
ncbi:MAG: sulfatase family protein [Planctomycetota bacterium]|jgi:arylsulfatase A-like enzyme